LKSSSRFFPARLVAAEVRGEFAEDVYLIKPNNSPDKKVEIAVTHLSLIEGVKVVVGASPIILLHGSYQNRRFWYSAGCDGLAKRLVMAGLDVWLMEARGHGLSPINERFDENTLADYARYDLPAVNTFVAEKTGAKPTWLGCNEGAAAALLSLACGGLSHERTAAIVGFGEVLPQQAVARIPSAHWLPALLAGPSCYNVLVGPERESIGLCRGIWRECSLLSYFGAQVGVNVQGSLAATDMPLGWLQAVGQSSVSGLGPLATLALKVLPIDLPLAQLGPKSLTISMGDPQALGAIVAPLLRFLGDGFDGVLPAGKASSVT